jgi:hypothetical protein
MKPSAILEHVLDVLEAETVETILPVEAVAPVFAVEPRCAIAPWHAGLSIAAIGAALTFWALWTDRTDKAVDALLSALTWHARFALLASLACQAAIALGAHDAIEAAFTRFALLTARAGHAG